jgi:hypothetical protein
VAEYIAILAIPGLRFPLETTVGKAFGVDHLFEMNRSWDDQKPGIPGNEANTEKIEVIARENVGNTMHRK